MANKKNELDDFNFDDFNFDNLDSISNAKHAKGPGPVSKLSSNFGTGARDALTDPSILRNFVSSALPDGYGTAINTTKDLYDGGAELYNIAARELRPALPAMRRTAGRIADSAGNMLPKGIKRRLEEFSKDPGTVAGKSAQELEDENIAAQVGGVFAAGIELQNRQHQADQAERRLRERVQDKFAMSQMRRLDQIGSGIDRLAAYQDQVTLKYQQKSLELQYRQLFATQAILHTHKQNQQRDMEFMNAILKNTSMSEATKAAFEQKAGNKFTERLRNQFTQGISAHMSGFMNQFKDNIANSLRSALGGFADIMGMQDDAAQMMKDAQEMGVDVSASGEASKYAGRWAMEKIMQMAAGPIRGKLSKNKNLTGMGARLNYFFQNLPEHITDWSRSRTDNDSIFGDLINMFKDMAPRKGLDHSFGVSALHNADEPATFDMQTRRSITEVIPGFLSKIHHELQMTRTGDTSLEPVTYNYVRGAFTSRTAAKVDMMRTVFNPRQIGLGRDGLNDFIDKKIDPEGKLSPQARQALMRQLMLDTVSGEVFKPERYMGNEYLTQELTGDSKDEVSKLIGARFKTGDRNDDAISLNEAAISFKTLRNLIIDPKAAMTVFRDAGQKDLLSDMGLVSNHMGQDSVNFAKIMDLILTEAEAEKPGALQENIKAAEALKAKVNSKMDAAADKVMDIYSQGLDHPDIQAVKMQMGEYRDQATGEVLRSVDDIKGPVVDRLGRVVLSARQMANGVRDSAGNVITRLQTAGWAFIAKHQDKVDAVKGAAASVQSSAESFVKAQQERFQRYRDIYAEGGREPLLQAIKMEAGEYRDQITGDLITKYEDIKGPVVNRYGEVVLSAQDLVKGLKDQHGERLEAITTRAKAAVQQLHEKHVKPMAGAFDNAGGGAGLSGQSEIGGPINAEMTELVSLNTQQVELLKVIAEILATNGVAGGDGKGPPSGPRGILDRLVLGTLKRGWSATKFAGRAYMGYLKGVGTAIGAGVTGIVKGAGAIGGRLLDMTRNPLMGPKDIYVKGDTEPALTAKKIRRQHYQDVKSGKTVKGVKDITGPVIDISDNNSEALSQAQFDLGLYVKSPNGLLRAIGGGALGLATNMVKGYFNLATLPLTAMRLGVNALKTGAKMMMNHQVDVYVKGEMQAPRLRAILMRQGKYYSAKTGAKIRGFKDIDGPVKELTAGSNRAQETDVEVLSEEDIKKGLVNSRGGELKTGVQRLLGVVGGVARGAGALVSGAARFYGRVVGGAMGLAGNLFGGAAKRFGAWFNPAEFGANSSRQTELLQAIHDLLDKRLPGKKARKGSYEEQVAERKAAKAKKDEETKKAETEKKSGFGAFLGWLKNKGSSFFGGGDEEEEGEDGGGGYLDDAADAADIYDATRGRGDKKLPPKGSRAWRRMVRKRAKNIRNIRAGRGLGRFGRIGRLASRIPGAGRVAGGVGALARGGGRALPIVGTALAVGYGAKESWDISHDKGLTDGQKQLAQGKTWGGVGGALGGAAAGAAIGSVVPILGTAVGGIVGGVVGGLAGTKFGSWVGGKAVGAWNDYKNKFSAFTNRDSLRQLRMAQYGVDVSDQSSVEKILKLEHATKNKLIEDESGLYDLVGLGGWFGGDAVQQQRFVQWMNQRFTPVYQAWVSATSLAGITESFDDVSKLDKEQKKQLINSVYSGASGAYSVNIHPFSDEPTAFGPEEVQNAKKLALADTEKGTMAKAFDKMKSVARTVNAFTPMGVVGNKVMDFVDKREDDKRLEGLRAADAAKNGAGGVVKGAAAAAMITSATAKGPRPMSSMTALEAIRYRTYGLRDMDTDRVRALQLLEADAAQAIQYGSGKLAFIGSAETLYAAHCATFGLSATDSAARSRWTDWFENRFVPTLLAFAEGVRTYASGSDPLEAARSLKANQLLEVGQAIAAAKRSILGFSLSVWSYDESPWDKTPLNTDSKTIYDNLMALKEGVRNRTVTEEKSKDAGGKNATGTADTSRAGGSGAGMSFTDRMKSWLMGSATQKSLWDRTKDGAQAAYDNASAAASQVRSGDYAGAARSAVQAATAPARYVTGMGTPPPLDIKGNAKDREKALIAEAIKAGITDPVELAMFLAQVAAETGHFKLLEENLRYRPEVAKRIFPRKFQSAAHAAQILSQGTPAFAEAIYGGRKDLGNNVPGDGFRYRGRGLMQLTGRYNYGQFAKWSGIDVVSNPDLVATDPRVAALTAVHYWKTRVQGKANPADLNSVSRLVNGGMNGIEHRRSAFGHYRQLFAGKTIQQIAAEYGVKANSVTNGGTGASSGGPATPAGQAPKAGATPANTTSGSAVGKPPTGTGFASAPVPSIDRSAGLPLGEGSNGAAAQDAALAQAHAQSVRAAAATDMRGRVANEDANRQMSAVVTVLEESLKTQREIAKGVTNISKEIGKLNGSVLAAAERSQTRVSENDKGGQSPRQTRGTEATPQAPVSMQRRYTG